MEFVVVSAETVGGRRRNLVAVVTVFDAVVVNIILREGGADAQQLVVEQQNALGRDGFHDELALHRGVVRIHTHQVGAADH